MPEQEPGPLGGVHLALQPTTPIANPQPGGLGAPVTLESLAAQVTALQTQLNTLQQQFETASRLINSHTHSISPILLVQNVVGGVDYTMLATAGSIYGQGENGQDPKVPSVTMLWTGPPV